MQARAERLAALRGRAFDVLVVGGGITGCGIARDAALRGLAVALVEKSDFASGTSSRSSRLVHGGVRYLEHGHLHLVFESSAERRRLLKLAPHLVRPLEFTWPVYRQSRIPRWKLGAGLMLYDLLALFRNVGRHRRLNRRAVLEREPSLRADGLLGGATYYDAATDDARLTLANAIAAQEAGAVVLNYATVTDLTRDGDRIAGAVVRDELSGTFVDVRAKVVVNATGPWSDIVRRFDDDGVPAPAIRGSKGVHIAVERERIGNRNALTLLSPRDGRVFFVLPAGNIAIIGTTDTFTTAPPDDVRANADDVAYLVDSANSFFPNAKLDSHDVIHAWAGIRPLLPAQGDAPGAASREHAIGVSRHGLVSITGGKLTTYRIMGAQVVDKVCALLGRSIRGDASAHTPLPGGDFRSLTDLIGEIARATNDVQLAEHLATAYGTRWRAVWEEISNDGGERLAPALPYTAGEMRYCVKHEMATTIGDLVLRRTRLGFESFGPESTQAVLRVAAAVAPLFGWNEEEWRRRTQEYRDGDFARIFSVG
jgi:glycerol-3-phosphate dehydrogenase